MISKRQLSAVTEAIAESCFMRHCWPKVTIASSETLTAAVARQSKKLVRHRVA
jgi:hypothetical protein